MPPDSGHGPKRSNIARTSGIGHQPRRERCRYRGGRPRQSPRAEASKQKRHRLRLDAPERPNLSRTTARAKNPAAAFISNQSTRLWVSRQFHAWAGLQHFDAYTDAGVEQPGEPGDRRRRARGRAREGRKGRPVKIPFGRATIAYSSIMPSRDSRVQSQSPPRGFDRPKPSRTAGLGSLRPIQSTPILLLRGGRQHTGEHTV